MPQMWPFPQIVSLLLAFILLLTLQSLTIVPVYINYSSRTSLVSISLAW